MHCKLVSSLERSFLPFWGVGGFHVWDSLDSLEARQKTSSAAAALVPGAGNANSTTWGILSS